MENKLSPSKSLSKAELIQAPRGTKDLLPEEAAKWRMVERTIDDVAQIFGYGEIRTPAFEQLRLFKRAVGEETDIVSKEMFLIESRNEEENYALRPELTAPVVRAAIEHGMLTGQSDCVKLYYNRAANFRHEKPQKGRFRQFHQFGTELLGPSSPLADAETISFAIAIYRRLGLSSMGLRLNSLGSSESRQAWKQELVPYFREHLSKLSSDSQRRVETNPLRVLDSKAAQDQDIIRGAPKLDSFYTSEDRSHFSRLQEALPQSLNPLIIIDPRLVRGIDYYTSTVFEITSDDLGAQDALCGGGRYNNLIEQLGGVATPAVGFGGGLERLLIANGRYEVHVDSKGPYDSKIYLIAQSPESRIDAFRAAHQIRMEGIPAVLDLNDRSVKAQMREANRLGSKLVCFISENDESAELKDMNTGDQERLENIRDLVPRIKQKLNLPNS